jgi:hypothetical protein
MSVTEKKPSRVPHHAVVGLRVTGGFLGGAKLDFADGLNCFIGGRGTGNPPRRAAHIWGIGSRRPQAVILP